ncbi:GNAT family N-acetyltransferase [Streptomyces sp. M19]
MGALSAHRRRAAHHGRCRQTDTPARPHRGRRRRLAPGLRRPGGDGVPRRRVLGAGALRGVHRPPARARRGARLLLLLLLDAGDRVVGFSGAQPWPHSWGPAGEIEIGWRLGRDHWGHGYATRGALAALDRVRRGCPSCGRHGQPGNARSIAVTERLGMRLARTYELPGSGPRACASAWTCERDRVSPLSPLRSSWLP